MILVKGSLCNYTCLFTLLFCPLTVNLYRLCSLYSIIVTNEGYKYNSKLDSTRAAMFDPEHLGDVILGRVWYCFFIYFLGSPDLSIKQKVPLLHFWVHDVKFCLVLCLIVVYSA